MRNVGFNGVLPRSIHSISKRVITSRTPKVVRLHWKICLRFVHAATSPWEISILSTSFQNLEKTQKSSAYQNPVLISSSGVFVDNNTTKNEW
jgi:hypothetical protein